MSDNKKREQILNEAIENITEEELQKIAAAGDTSPEFIPVVITVLASAAASAALCKK